MTARVGLLRPAALALAGTALIAGCAASERQRPLQTSPIATSGNTLQAARKQLEGRWTLVSLEYASPDGKRATVEGTTGVLTADAFGNLEIEYRLSEGGLKALGDLGFKTPNAVISTKGRSVINVDQQSIVYVDEKAQPFDPKVAAGRQNPFALERTRYYDFGADGLLTLTTRHDDGKDAAVSKWRKG
jgi:hypothetical protein